MARYLETDADPELLSVISTAEFSDALRLTELMDVYPNATAAQMLEIVRNREGKSRLFVAIDAALDKSVTP